MDVEWVETAMLFEVMNTSINQAHIILH